MPTLILNGVVRNGRVELSAPLEMTNKEIAAWEAERHVKKERAKARVSSVTP